MSRNAFLALVFLISISVATDLRVHAADEGDKAKSHGEQVTISNPSFILFVSLGFVFDSTAQWSNSDASHFKMIRTADMVGSSCKWAWG